MLSRKQHWRMACGPQTSYEEKIQKKLIQQFNEEESFNDKSISSFLFPTNSKKKITKSVSFDTIVNVILIPEINDYKNAKLFNELWYSENELELFKIIRLKELYKSMSPK